MERVEEPRVVTRERWVHYRKVRSHVSERLGAWGQRRFAAGEFDVGRVLLKKGVIQASSGGPPIIFCTGEEVRGGP